MKKILLIPLLLLSLLHAIDWSERSTQELIAALDHAQSENIPVILHELKKREMTMSPKEKKAYKEKLKKLEELGKIVNGIEK